MPINSLSSQFFKLSLHTHFSLSFLLFFFPHFICDTNVCKCVDGSLCAHRYDHHTHIRRLKWLQPHIIAFTRLNYSWMKSFFSTVILCEVRERAGSQIKLITVRTICGWACSFITQYVYHTRAHTHWMGEKMKRTKRKNDNNDSRSSSKGYTRAHIHRSNHNTMCRWNLFSICSRAKM